MTKNVQFSLSVPPKLILTFKGESNITEVTVEEHTIVNITCYAFGARPGVNLTWINQAGVNLVSAGTVTFVSENDERYGKKTFDSESVLSVYLDSNRGAITCKSLTESGIGNRAITVSYYTYGKICSLPFVFKFIVGL